MRKDKVSVFLIFVKFLSFSASLIVAINQVRKSAAEKKMKFWEYGVLNKMC